MDKEFYTIEEAAEKMGVSKRSLEDAIRTNQLVAHKRFSKWYIFHEDLIAFIRAA